MAPTLRTKTTEVSAKAAKDAGYVRRASTMRATSAQAALHAHQGTRQHESTEASREHVSCPLTLTNADGSIGTSRSTMANASTSPLLRLPLEIRNNT
jgi:hypothetical protein